MAEFKLGRLKFVWKGDWATGANYVKDDIVNYGGKSFVCVQGHTAASNFYTDSDTNYWELMADGFQWKGDWAINTWYKEGDVVSHGGKSYIAVDGHTSGSSVSSFYTALAASDWELLTDGQEWKNAWVDDEWYKIGDIVRHGGKSYICTEGHTSASNFYTDLTASKWQLVNDGFEWKGEWDASTWYKLNDVVRFGGGLYIANVGHTSASHFEEAKWDVFVEGYEFENSWSNSTEYQMGDVVAYGGYTYIALRRNTGVTPTQSLLDWKPFLEGINSAGTWSNILAYRTGDIVMYGGNTYMCIQDTEVGTTPEDGAYFSLFSEGFRWVGNWSSSSVRYKVGDVVKQSTNSYICIQHHTSENAKSPLNDTSNTYWNNLADGSALTTLTTRGDVLFRDATGNARLPIGNENDILVVDAFGEPAWSADATIQVTSINVLDDVQIDATGDDGGLYIGEGAITEVAGGAGSSGFTDASAVMIKNVDAFTQVALKNTNDGPAASTDLIVYADNGDNDSGWMDMGITSSNFDITSGYGITGKNDGYIFMSAPAGTTGTGNLVIATGENGAERDIVFVTGGFDPVTNTDAEKLRIIGEGRIGATFTGSINGTTLTVTAASPGVITFDGTHNINGTNIIPGTTIIAQVSGVAGGTGVYTVNQRQTVASTEIIQDLNPAGVEIYIDTESHSPYSGALRVQGGIGLAGNLNLEGELVAYGGAIYQGRDGGVTAKQLTEDDALYSGYVGLTNASGVFTGDADDFVQFALKNHSSGTGASTDIIAYASNGDNDSGWIDMGITSETYSDPDFSVTGPDTGYIFMSAPAGTSNGGDLLIGTDATGVTNDIIIFSNGFDGGNERLRIIGASRAGHAEGVEILAPTESTSTSTGALRVNGGIGLVGNMNVGGNVNIVGTITVGGSGSALETQTLAVSDPMIKMGTGNSADAIDLGFYGTYSNITTTLTGSLSNSATTINVGSAVSFPATGNVFIDSEEITYTGKTSTSLTGCTRGANGSTAAAHDSGATVYVPYFTGLVRDASDGAFKLFRSLNTVSPTSVVNFAASEVAMADLMVGAFTANGTTSLGGSTGSTTINNDLAIATGKVVKIDSSTVRTKSSATFYGSSSGSVTLQAAAAAGSATFTLPTADGTNGQALVTNGSGTLSFATPVSIADDTSTNSTYYPTFATASSGGFTTAKVSSTKLTFNPSTGTLTSTIVTASSDSRLKENVRPLTNALEKTLALEGVMFNRIGSTTDEVGVIAQQVEKIVPELVFTDDKGMKSVAYANTVALLIEAIKEQQAQIEELKKKVA